MELSDRRVVLFREWAEKRFAIGSGGYPQAEDLLSVVMAAVDARLGVPAPIATLKAHSSEDPAFLDWLRKELNS